MNKKSIEKEVLEREFVREEKAELGRDNVRKIWGKE